MVGVLARRRGCSNIFVSSSATRDRILGVTKGRHTLVRGGIGTDGWGTGEPRSPCAVVSGPTDVGDGSREKGLADQIATEERKGPCRHECESCQRWARRQQGQYQIEELPSCQ